MTQPLQFHSQVGPDGVLNVQVNLGASEAKRDVVVTIQPLSQPGADANQLDWHEFLNRTYGSCAGLGVERPELGIIEASSRTSD
jgi:hypothetical protein